MAKQPFISQSFVKTAGLFITVISTTVLTVLWGIDKIKDVVRDEIKPLVEEIEKLKKNTSESQYDLDENFISSNASFTSLEKFLDYYNKNFNKEFLKPSDVLRIESKRKRKNDKII